MAFQDNLETIAERQIIAGRNVWIGSTAPVSPAQNDIWIETSSQFYGYTWVWIGSGWASEIKTLSSNFDGLWSTSSTSPLRAFIPICDKAGIPGYVVVLRRFVIGYMMPTTSHSITNMYTFTLFWRSSSTGSGTQINTPIGSPTTASANSTTATLLNYNTSASVANRSYHEGFAINAIIGTVGAVGAFQVDCTRTGTPTPIYGCAALAYVQFLRP